MRLCLFWEHEGECLCAEPKAHRLLGGGGLSLEEPCVSVPWMCRPCASVFRAAVFSQCWPPGPCRPIPGLAFPVVGGWGESFETALLLVLEGLTRQEGPRELDGVGRVLREQATRDCPILASLVWDRGSEYGMRRKVVSQRVRLVAWMKEGEVGQG